MNDTDIENLNKDLIARRLDSRMIHLSEILSNKNLLNDFYITVTLYDSNDNFLFNISSDDIDENNDLYEWFLHYTSVNSYDFKTLTIAMKRGECSEVSTYTVLYLCDCYDFKLVLSNNVMNMTQVINDKFYFNKTKR